MPGLLPNLPANERVICAIDTSDEVKAENLVQTASRAGAWIVKLGLEYSSRTSWRECSELAEEYGLAWVADAKLPDIPNTVAGAVNNLAELRHPPSGITIYTKSGLVSLEDAQKIAHEADIMMLGVTHLTSIGEEETKRYEGRTPREIVYSEASRAKEAGIGGLVCAGTEVKMIKQYFPLFFTMIPGTRSAGIEKGDQARVITPGQAIEDGADLLVIGRQISQAPDPAEAYEQLIEEIAQAMERQ